jgi:Leucine-rich repeat (LRR) protein
MTLLTTIALTIGGALVKHVTAGYLGEGPKSQVAQDLLDLVRDQLGDGLTARPEQRSIEQVAQQVTQKLLPLFAQESHHLEPATKESITLAVARTLMTGKIDADLLLQQRLDPARLANTLIAKAPESSAGFSPDETILYRRLLTESCRHLVGIANHFAGYEILVDRRLLTGQDELLAQLARLLAEPDERRATYERRYRDQLAEELNRFEQIGIDYAEGVTRRQPLSRAYVPLQLAQSDGWEYRDPTRRRGMGREELSPFGFDQGRHSAQPTVGSIQEMLALTPRLVIRGQPGSGKSTLLRWLAIQCAQGELSQGQPALTTWDLCVPFYIQLRAYVNKPLPNPLEWPTLHLEMMALRPPDTWIEDLLTDGRALVLLDGVDEVPEKQRGELLERLQDLMRAYPLARYIITSRPAALKAWPEWLDWSRQQGFLSVTMQEMNLPQIFGFVEQWHDALQTSLSDPKERMAVQTLVQPLKQLLSQRPALRQLAGNPLLCTMICSLHRQHPKSIPENRVSLYQSCVELLLYKRDVARNVRSLEDYPPPNYTQQDGALCEYAHRLMWNGESEEDVTDADDFFTQFVDKMNMPGWDGAQLRRYFLERTGLLIETAEGRIAFAHRTFQEFLTARVVAENGQIPLLLQQARKDQWRETILLTMGVREINERKSKQLLSGLLKRAAELSTPRARQELYLLAVACLESARFRLPALREEILAKAATLIPPRDNDAVALIAKGGNPMVELLRFNPRYSVKRMARCVAALIAIGSEAALTALAEYAAAPIYEEARAYPLRRAIAQGIFAFEPTYYYQRVLTGLQSLDLSSTQVSDAGLVHLQALTGLQSIYLRNTQVSDAGLAHFHALTGLQSLDLSSTQVSDTGLRHLQPLTSLQSLYLIDTQVSDAGLVHLQPLTSLQSLALVDTQVSDAGLVHLQPLTSLQSLALVDTQVSDAGLVHLQPLISLQSLDISNTQVGDTGLRHLQPLTSLQSLDISNTQVGDTGLRHLQPLTSLQSLYLIDTQVSDAGLVHLQPLTSLQSLVLWNAQVSDAGLVHLQPLTSLQSLGLSSTQVGDAGLVHLHALTGLQSLYLSSTQVGNAGLAHLHALTKLQSLDLSDTQVSDAGLAHLHALTELQVLDLMNTQVSDAGLAHLHALTELQVLDLMNTQVSDAGLVHLHALTGLQSLDLNETQVKDTSVLDHLLGLDIEL